MELVAKLFCSFGEFVIDSKRQIAHADVQQLVVRQACPIAGQRGSEHPDDLSVAR
jgi:hypothetical protein